MKKGDLVKILDFQSDKTSLSGEKGIIVKGPYESSFSFSKNIRQISLVYDVLINGKIYNEILKEKMERL